MPQEHFLELEKQILQIIWTSKGKKNVESNF